MKIPRGGDVEFTRSELADAILAHANPPEEEGWFSRREMELETGMTRYAVAKVLEELVASGKAKKKDGRRRRDDGNLYRVTLYKLT